MTGAPTQVQEGFQALPKPKRIRRKKAEIEHERVTQEAERAAKKLLRRARQRRAFYLKMKRMRQALTYATMKEWQAVLEEARAMRVTLHETTEHLKLLNLTPVQQYVKGVEEGWRLGKEYARRTSPEAAKLDEEEKKKRQERIARIAERVEGIQPQLAPQDSALPPTEPQIPAPAPAPTPKKCTDARPVAYHNLENGELCVHDWKKTVWCGRLTRAEAFAMTGDPEFAPKETKQ